MNICSVKSTSSRSHATPEFTGGPTTRECLLVRYAVAGHPLRRRTGAGWSAGADTPSHSADWSLAVRGNLGCDVGHVRWMPGYVSLLMVPLHTYNRKSKSRMARLPYFRGRFWMLCRSRSKRILQPIAFFIRKHIFLELFQWQVRK